MMKRKYIKIFTGRGPNKAHLEREVAG